MPNGFRSIPSTEQRLESVERKFDQIVNRLDMILDAMTKPTVTNAEAEPKLWPAHTPMDESEAKSTIGLFRAYDANTMEPVDFKLEEPKRLSGKPAKEQIERWIEDHFRSVTIFSLTAKAGYVTAKIEAKAGKADDTHRYTHRLRLKDDATGEAFNPTLFGITEAREVVAYLESLGVKVNTNALNRA